MSSLKQRPPLLALALAALAPSRGGRHRDYLRHLDHADGCSAPPTRYGSSEIAERRVAGRLGQRGWRVQVDRVALGNAEPYRRDVSNPAHLWWSDGHATVITVP